MAGDVSSTVKGSNSEVLSTRDLLGELSKVSNKDLDLDLQVPNCREMPLDMKSGIAYRERCNCPNSPLSSINKKHKQRATKNSEVQDLTSFPPLQLLEESCLELKLVPSSPCQSVCTLDKVKSALQRAEKQNIKKRSLGQSLSFSTKVKKDDGNDAEEEKSSITSKGMFAAGCPGCLLYVITLKTNPKCPHCNSTVPSALLVKRPRIDLNASL